MRELVRRLEHQVSVDARGIVSNVDQGENKLVLYDSLCTRVLQSTERQIIGRLAASTVGWTSINGNKELLKFTWDMCFAVTAEHIPKEFLWSISFVSNSPKSPKYLYAIQ